MTSVYLSYLPRAFIRSIAGFPQEGKGYFLPRACETPPAALCLKIWPEVDVWLERMKAYRPEKADNEVVRLDLAGSGFLRLLRALRVVLLQDSVVLRKEFPHHPLWKDPLFDGEEYRRFARRVEDSLVNVVTPDELKMQQFWPAHEAVAKLRHEAVTSEIRSVRSDVQLMLERLDEAERSSSALTSASTSSPPPMAPIWIQQGQTGIWIGPADPAVHPPTAATGAPVPQPDLGTGTPAPLQAPPVRPARPLPPGQIVLDPQAPPSAY